jgi:hypothetical protein
MPGDYSSQQAAQQIGSDPRSMLPLRVAGSMQAWSTPAHKVGTTGSVYSYGGTPAISGTTVVGHRNLIHNGYAAHAVGSRSTLQGTSLTLLLGGGLYDVLTAKEAGAQVVTNLYDTSTAYALMNNGEAVFQATLGALYGASNEIFTVAGTVDTVTNGTANITGLGTLWTTSIIPGYAYVTSMAIARPGDVIRITQGANIFFHRIVSITSPTAMTIFPPWQGTTAGPGAGLAYQIGRTGYGSYSRVVSIFNSTSNTFFNYYAGNLRTPSTLPGTIECFTTNSTGTASSHFMCPQTSAALDIAANDIAYYKGFLLYGANSAIAWSVAGFPTSFVTAFGATDFPAGNITVVDNGDQFQTFEFIGDQLVALFRNGAWLVNPTGSVPEFNFYKLSEPIGASILTTISPEVLTDLTLLRPSCSARASVFYVSKTGLMELNGNVAQEVSQPVKVLTAIQNTIFGTPTWEPSTESIILYSKSQTSNLVYTIPTKSWSILDPSAWASGTAVGLTGDVGPGAGKLFAFFRFGAGYWDSGIGSICAVDGRTGGIATSTGLSSTSWQWASPVQIGGDSIDGFTFGGFQVEGLGLQSNATWTLYGGQDPYSLVVRDTGTIGANPQTDRLLYGSKIQDAFWAIVLAGTQTVQLVGANVYEGRAGRGR